MWTGSSWNGAGGGTSSSTLADIATNSSTTAQQTFALDAGTRLEFKDSSGNEVLVASESDGVISSGLKKILGQYPSSHQWDGTEQILQPNVAYLVTKAVMGEAFWTSLEICVTTLQGSPDLIFGAYSFDEDGAYTLKAKRTVTLVQTGLIKALWEDYVMTSDGDDNIVYAILFTSGLNGVMVRAGTPQLQWLSCKVEGSLTDLPDSIAYVDRTETNFQIMCLPRVGELVRVFPPATAWTGANDASSVEWWDATDNTTQTLGANQAGYPGSVTSWVGKTAASALTSSNDYAQPKRGIYTHNGLQTLYFDTNDNMTNPFGSFNIGASGNLMLIMVMAVNAGSINAVTDSPFALISSNDFEVRAGSTTQFLFHVNTNVATDLFSGATDYADGAARIYCVKFDFTNSVLANYVNGNQLYSVSDYVSKLSATTQINLNIPNMGWSLSQLILTNDVTDATRLKYEGWLAHKYGLPATLPYGHIYKRMYPGV